MSAKVVPLLEDNGGGYKKNYAAEPNTIGQQTLSVDVQKQGQEGKEDENEKRKPNLPRFYNSKKTLKDPTTVIIFNCVVSTLVLAQSIVIAFRMNDVKRTIDADGNITYEQGKYNSTAMDSVEMIIQCFFLARLVTNVIILGKDEWMKDWIVNTIDSFIIVAGIISVVVLEIALSPGEGFQPTDNVFTAVYVFRWIRACRTLVVFYRYFREVRLLINGIINAFIQMFWVIGIQLTVNLMMAILLCSFIQSRMAYMKMDDPNALQDPLDPADPSLTKEVWLNMYFGETDKTMLTLYQVMTGDSWSWDVSRNCMDWLDAPGVAWYFIVYQIITSYGLLNLITGVFVEATVAIKENDVETQLNKKEEDSNETIDILNKLFDDCDKNDDQTIDRAEFETLITDRGFAGTLVKLGLDMENAKKMWKILERGGDGTIDLCEFCEGILTVKNGVGPLDLISLENVHRSMKRELRKVETKQQEAIDSIDKELDRIIATWTKRGSII
eukprot:GDKI01035027.1.p1 GENE.GDKI01035027.1~~GDKI01035027.1.p1  ORF type:complete len:498 (-),score=100.00 GDKI01035027.1:100-1593(-)